MSLQIPNQTEIVGKIKDTVSRCGGVTCLIMLSGAHMYGYPSRNSDYDYRGFYIMRTGKLLELKYDRRNELLDQSNFEEFNPKEIDISLQEIRRFVGHAMTMNCNILEHIFAEPLYSTTEALDLRALIGECLSKKGLYDSYKGMAEFNYKKFIYTGQKRTVKKWLYIFRALLAGIHVLTQRRVEPDIFKLNQKFNSGIVYELIEDKRSGLEDDIAIKKYVGIEDERTRWKHILDDAYLDSSLPEEPLDDYWTKASKWLKKIRQRYWDYVS